jgi:hypothetical protein
MPVAGGTILHFRASIYEKLSKLGRRPDIIYETSGGVRRGVNVGRTKPDGAPLPREQSALDDLNGPGKLPTDFVPYN